VEGNAASDAVGVAGASVGRDQPSDHDQVVVQKQFHRPKKETRLLVLDHDMSLLSQVADTEDEPLARRCPARAEGEQKTLRL
jgi:hypothetical protein